MARAPRPSEPDSGLPLRDPVARGWWAAALRPAPATPAALLDEVFALEPEVRWRSVSGRETFPWPGRPGLVVKRFEGGPSRDWWYERLKEGEVPRSPARREAETLRALAAEHLPAPVALAWVEEDATRRHPGLGGKGGRSALVMGRIEIEQTLRQALARADAVERERLGRSLLALVSRLHAGGWYHRDLYLEHVVLLATGELALLDLGRARREPAPRERWFVKDLAALYLSAPGAVPPRARLRFLAGWLRGRAASTRGRPHDLRRWSRVVQAKAQRMARHAPRDSDPSGARAAAAGGDA